MRNNEIIVSIICLAYNHEKYIRQCLEGFVCQKTTFNFEVLVHDDASIDGTAEIIREYEKKYPHLIKPIYQSENQYSKKVGIVSTFILPKAKGKYIAYCEGDDYWVDYNKLQRQVEALEKNPDCYICVSRVDVVEEDDSYSSRNQNRRFPSCDEKWDSVKGVEKLHPYLYQLSGYLLNAEKMKAYYYNPPKFKSTSDVGDLPLLLYFSQLGNIYVISKCLSHYRINSIGSWHDRTENANVQLLHFNKMIKMLYEYDDFTKQRFHKIIMYKILNYQFSVAKITKDYKKLIGKINKKVWETLALRQKIRIVLYCISPKLGNKVDTFMGRKKVK